MIELRHGDVIIAHHPDTTTTLGRLTAITAGT
jgi:hypothetical protein